MNILILSWRDINNPKAGGSEKYFHEMAKRWVKLGNKVNWISGGWKNCLKKELIDGVNIIRTGGEMSVYFLAPFEYFRLKEKPDIIIDNENGIPFFSPLYSKRKKFLHIHHVHKEIWKKEVMRENFKGYIIGKIGLTLESKIMPLVYRNTKVITLCKSSADEIVKEKFTNQKPFVVNPGIDFSNYKKFSKNKKPAILFLNRIKKYKGLDIFLEAVLIIKKSGLKNFEVWVAGSGDDLKRNEKYTKKNNLKEVKFLGRVSEEKKQELMQRAWVFVNPSFKEGWGIVNIEANFYGTPVIGSDVSGIKDSVIENKTGFLFPYKDYYMMAEKLIYLIKNPKKRNELSKNAKNWSTNFNWEYKAKEYLELLKKHAFRDTRN